MEVQECGSTVVLGQKLPNIIGRYPIKLWAVMEATCNMFAHLVETKMIVIGQNVSVQEYTLILSGYKLKRISSHFLPIESYELQREHDVAKG